MRAFQTALRPSRILNILTVSLHSASLAVCLTWFYGRMMWFGLAALAASYAYSLRITNLKHRHAITAITIDRDGQAEIVSGKEKTAKAAALSGSSMVTPYALFLQWDTGGTTVSQCIIPDMTDKESYRKLKVWVLWRQPKKTAETDTPS
ncbi:transcriptional regulator FolI [Neisseria meningitidis]|uniref:protein YgfX n=1 Tax=Neisseria meningitidis TaxID=487 RepID=UPI0002F13A9F|nr:protein YgfX [Neisseria meningitidis]MBG8579366.1 transcriptional regulator FolI [Neisseria meningitidis]MBG8594536.1 transcriptional regulator FolI [Neisseria meningitidis]MBG8602332.1 transcriptional regulator FolI [Neisseria meningitidis]MBG8605395.1 transcriptional regulator FolI [Neisseria meningitidis]MBG8609028.1 transcriptional regulator FolI [Neisseria meningitidis]